MCQDKPNQSESVGERKSNPPEISALGHIWSWHGQATLSVETGMYLHPSVRQS